MPNLHIQPSCVRLPSHDPALRRQQHEIQYRVFCASLGCPARFEPVRFGPRTIRWERSGRVNSRQRGNGPRTRAGSDQYPRQRAPADRPFTSAEDSSATKRRSSRPDRQMIRAFSLVLLASVGPWMTIASAQTGISQYPYCIQGIDNPRWSGCSYNTMQACQASASGTEAECLANPWYRAGGKQREPSPMNPRRRPAQLEAAKARHQFTLRRTRLPRAVRFA